jgi:hypothetical protein
MKIILIRSLAVVLGTLLAAALVAIGAPGDAEVQMAVQGAPSAELVASLFVEE